jgi:hypothetical protein
MGDVPIAYVEEAGGVRVSEDEIVTVGKHDVRARLPCRCLAYANIGLADTFIQSRPLATCRYIQI